MTARFLILCDQILAAASSSNLYDASEKSLSTLLNEMTHYVATTITIENGDELIISGYICIFEK